MSYAVPLLLISLGKSKCHLEYAPYRLVSVVQALRPEKVCASLGNSLLRQLYRNAMQMLLVMRMWLQSAVRYTSQVS